MTDNWRDYQESVAAFFRELGFSAETDVVLEGARTLTRGRCCRNHCIHGPEHLVVGGV